MLVGRLERRLGMGDSAAVATLRPKYPKLQAIVVVYRDMVASPLRHIIRMLTRIHTHRATRQMPAHYRVELSVGFVIEQVEDMLLHDFDDSRLHYARSKIAPT